MADSPDVSVVIASGRDARLAFALDALAEQQLGGAGFEVIVVRQHGRDRLDDPPGLTVKWVDGAPGHGPAAMRNAGWRASSGRLIAFTDDDCRPQPDWLAQLVGAHQPGAIVQGLTDVDPEERHLLHGTARSQVVIGPSDWYPTCNILYERDLLVRLDGFDEDFPAAYGEDTDLGLRARAAGVELIYTPDAVVWHAVLPRTPLQALREARRAQWLVPVIARHPEQRKALYHGFFLTKAHLLVLLALLGIPVSRFSRPVALALTVPYIRARVGIRRRKIPQAFLRLPSRFAIDLNETLATIRGAIRFRTPMA